MEIKGTKDSHIQIPKSLLKPFSSPVSIVNSLGLKETPDMVFKMDMEGNISQESIKEANTEFGYYEDIIETILLKKYEDDFGDLKSRLLNSLKRHIKPNFTDEDRITVKKICSLSLVRSPSFVADVREKSISLDSLANEPQNSILYFYFQNPELIDDYILGKNISYVENKSNLNYVLPQFYTIGMKSNDKTYTYFIPIAPKILLVLTTAETSFMNKPIPGIMLEFDVDNLNKLAIKHEFQNNHRAVYAKEKEDLERYVPFIKSLSKR